MTDTWHVLQDAGLLLPDLDATPVGERGLCVVDGIISATDNAGVVGQYINEQSVLFNDLLIQHNLAAVVAPTATDDSAAGYSIGSVWIDTATDTPYICVDDTATAAVWVSMDASGAAGNEVALALFAGRHRTSNAAYREVARGVISTDRIPATSPEFIFEVITPGGGGGSSVRLRDITNAANLAELTAITTGGIKVVAVTLPTPGDIVWSLEHANPGTGTAEIAGAVLQVND